MPVGAIHFYKLFNIATFVTSLISGNLDLKSQF